MNIARSARAFTLLELLLAATISVLLAGALLSLTSSALTLWQRVRANAVTTTQGTQALDFLEADLQGAILRPEYGATFACDAQSSESELQRHGWHLTGMRKPAGSASWRPPGGTPRAEGHAYRFGLGGVWLRFLTTKADTHADARRASAPAVVSYQLMRRALRTGARYELCRSIVRPGASAGGAAGTFEAGYDVTAATYLSPSTVPGDPGTVTTPSAIDVLAVDVVDFGVVIHSRTPDGALAREFPVQPGSVYRNTARGPAVVDVFIRLLTSEGARALAAFEQLNADELAPDSADRWWQIVDQHSHVHVRRVELKQP